MKRFEDILEECLEEVLTGAASLEECLNRYPEYAQDLQECFRVTSLLQRVQQVEPPDRLRESLRRQLIEAVAARRSLFAQSTPASRVSEQGRTTVRWALPSPRFALALAAAMVLTIAASLSATLAFMGGDSRDGEPPDMGITVSTPETTPTGSAAVSAITETPAIPDSPPNNPTDSIEGAIARAQASLLRIQETVKTAQQVDATTVRELKETTEALVQHLDRAPLSRETVQQVADLTAQQRQILSEVKEQASSQETAEDIDETVRLAETGHAKAVERLSTPVNTPTSVPSATSTPTPEPTPTVTATPAASPTPEPSPTATATPTHTPSPTPEASASPTSTPTPTPEPTPTSTAESASPTPTASGTPSPTSTSGP